MRIYITGIDGMLGQAIAYLHRKQGDEVYGCDVWVRSLDDYRITALDIRDYASLSIDVLRVRPDRLYHCAAMLGVQNTENYPEVCRQINEQGTLNVFEAAQAANVAEFIFLSSSEVYGNPIEAGPLHEGSPLFGDNVYAIGKAISERKLLYSGSGIAVKICRMFNCYGMGQVRQFLIPKVVERMLSGMPVSLYGSPSNRRSYLLSHDAAKHIIDVADSAPKGCVVNIAHPDTYTLEEVFCTLKALTKSKSTYSVATERYEDRAVRRDVPNRIADITLLKQYSDHIPADFDVAAAFFVQTFASTFPDWNYSRSLF